MSEASLSPAVPHSSAISFLLSIVESCFLAGSFRVSRPVTNLCVHFAPRKQPVSDRAKQSSKGGVDDESRLHVGFLLNSES